MLTKIGKRVPNNITTTFLRRFTSSSELVRIEFTNGIKQIVMSDQKTRNSLSIAMLKILTENIRNEHENHDIRAIVISGEGPVFSAGHNLKELANNYENQNICFKCASELMSTIIDSPIPIIGKIDGIAAAAGCQLVAQCDIAVCSEKSKFSTPGANFGIFCSTPGVALARCVNKMASLHMLLTGLPVSAEEAKQIGLVTKVCPREKLNEEIDIICNAIKTKSRDVIELGKHFYYKQIQFGVKEAYKLGADKMVENLQLPDCQEGIQSFLEKRKPQWGAGKKD